MNFLIQNPTELRILDIIEHIDLDLSGSKIGAIDREGNLVISDANTDAALTTREFPAQASWGCNRCLWIPIAEQPILFVKFGGGKLNLLNTEKNTLVLKSGVQLEKDGKLFNYPLCESKFVNYI